MYHNPVLIFIMNKNAMTEPATTTPPTGTSNAGGSPHLRAVRSLIWEIIKVVVLAGITIALIRYFLFKPFYVKGASMEPNFQDNQYLIIDELTYRFRAPERGEIIVFHYPPDPSEYFLKRVIGLPGEHIKIADGQVTIYNSQHPEGLVLDETYLPKGLQTSGSVDMVLGPTQYFVMGDNRPYSFDSRSFGPIDRSVIVGRAVFRGWPLNDLELFSPPSYNS